jgi:hypothetical protein
LIALNPIIKEGGNRDDFKGSSKNGSTSSQKRIHFNTKNKF